MAGKRFTIPLRYLLNTTDGVFLENFNLKKENKQLKQAYQTLKHRHSLLHDVCLETECDRDSLKKDVIFLEKENKDLKDFIRKISTNNEIILANGTIYKIDKVILE